MAGPHRLLVTDTDYPKRLQALADPDRPPFLWVDGAARLDPEKTIAVVGSRSPFYKAAEVAELVGCVAAREGYTVVSGYATGIDTCGHYGAMDAGGPTIAVLGSGINKRHPCKPALERYVLSKGAFVSELEDPDAEREYEHLMARDRITSALSDLIIVVETDAKGGAVHTAQCAVAQGRRAFAIEWTGHHKYCDKAQAGTAYMVKQGIAERLPIADAGEEFVLQLRKILSSIHGASTHTA